VSPRVPPYSIEAEQSVLGGLLLNNRAWHEVSATVRADDFYREDHQLIWRAICELIGDGKPCDFVTLTEYLRHRGTLEEAGGLSYLGALANETPSAANVQAYADLVRERSVLRSAIAVGGDIAEMGYRPEGRSAAEVLASGMSRLIALETRQQGRAQRFTEAFDVTERAIVELRDRRRRGLLAGAPTGIGELDEAIGGVGGPKLIILAARPGVGKTALLNLAGVSMARAGFGGAIFSLEMSVDALVIRALAAESDCNVTGLSRGDENDFRRACDALPQIGDIPLWIDCDTYDLAGICAQAAMLRHRHGIQWIAVDHLGLVETPRFNSRNDQVGHISRTLKQLAKRLNIPVIALSQLSRECEKEGRRPLTSDLRDSGNIEQDADQVIFLHSPYDQRNNAIRTLDIGVLKNRGGRAGWITGYEFHGSSQRVVRAVGSAEAMR
jgi:replicative DNA helicase